MSVIDFHNVSNVIPAMILLFALQFGLDLQVGKIYAKLFTENPKYKHET